MKVLFMGSGDIALPVLRWLGAGAVHRLCGVVCQPDKPAGRRMALTPPPTRPVAEALGVPVLQPARVREPGALDAIRALAPEVIVVMAYGQMLPKALLELPPAGCLNLHASLLPRHRGASPVQAAVEAGDAESGITVMWMDEGLDTGDVLLRRSLKLARHETGGSLHARLSELAVPALADALELVAAGRAGREPQDGARATLAPKLRREHGRIDWTASAESVGRRVRAMEPWPGAFTHLRRAAGELKLKVYRCAVNRRRSGEPGCVLAARPRGVLVGAGSGSVLLMGVQPEGSRRMTAREFLAGHPLVAGDRFV